MIALTKYEASLLVRSHRWIPAAVLYVLGVIFLGGTSGPATVHGAGLAPGLSWSALMLVPCVALLTRSMLTAEPAAARACVAAAGGPRRAHLAALLAPLGMGVVLGLVGVAWALVHFGMLRTPGNVIRVGATFSAVGGGLGAALICLLVGSAVGALFNPPVVRRPAAGMLCTTAGVVLGLAWSGSPANAAVRSAGYGDAATSWPPGVPVVVAIALVAAAWAVSALVAAQRG